LGVIEASDGSKLAFILSDFASHQRPQEGLRVSFSIRSVKGRIFASHVYAQRDALKSSLANNSQAATIGSVSFGDF
jgi:hypothetical protein